MLREEVNHRMAHVEGRKLKAKFHAKQVHPTGWGKSGPTAWEQRASNSSQNPEGEETKALASLVGLKKKTAEEE